MALYDGDTYDLTEVDSLWRTTARPGRDFPRLEGDIQAEVAIIGAGFTGLSAALHLAREHGIGAVALEAGPIGWGASGRNGGFCVPGGDKLGLAAMAKRWGADEARRYHALTLAAVERVAGVLRDEAIEAEPQPGGELTMAHSPRAFAEQKVEREEILALTGHERELLSAEALVERGLSAGFVGGLREPVGFGLHPLNYVRGLAASAARHGARLFEHSAVTSWRREGQAHRLETATGSVVARKVIVATGGYPPEQINPQIGGRVLPVLSNIIATRPLTAQEQAAQGWTSTQAVDDSRALLHYFRLLPDGRFLFGGRGGLGGSDASARSFRARLTAEFHTMFPAWRHVEITHFWRGLVDLSADLAPHCGALEEDQTILMGCAYHGSGVSMGSETGTQLARLAAGLDTPALPGFMRRPPPRFPLPGLRKLYLAGALAGFELKDRFG
ncbi:NAD(P)/FAD-dependent oxidoreductase [Phenylobacterium montanum]|uniref:FAD-binding oxidoreductase n=1 Tax=Phenylobacterium montanum TaxID=2823693 RepID=A0A975IV47_9CAUL|nr:FAD-binding oxidoreductase [Caulobacter sp. S6]QUD88199.1 FAD-binding oxidoreductase [Caulobacter sp. S6]